jgi:hypothetical protein
MGIRVGRHFFSKWLGEGRTEEEALEDLSHDMRPFCFNLKFYSKNNHLYAKFDYKKISYSAPVIIEKEDNYFYAYVV